VKQATLSFYSIRFVDISSLGLYNGNIMDKPIHDDSLNPKEVSMAKSKGKKKAIEPTPPHSEDKSDRLKRKFYEAELSKLQLELVNSTTGSKRRA
jgi:hypothetical protein